MINHLRESKKEVMEIFNIKLKALSEFSVSVSFTKK